MVYLKYFDKLQEFLTSK